MTKAVVFQLYPSYLEETLVNKYNIPYCCDYSCCSELLETATQNDVEQTLPTGTDDGMSMFVNIVASPQMWTLLLVMLLLLLLIIQHIVARRKKNRILPILERESSGPFSSTRVGTTGVIMPHVVYREKMDENKDLEEVKVEENIDEQNMSLKENFKDEQEMLSAMDLLVTLKEKIIDEDIFVILPLTNSSRVVRKPITAVKRCSSLKDESPRKKKKGLQKDVLRKTKKASPKPTIRLNQPLSPAYHPSRVVSEVWQGNHQLDHLYRYTNFDRLVYPPGFLQEEMNNNNFI